MPKGLKQVWNAVTTVFVVLVVILALLLVGVRLVGIKPYTVLSGSMEPTYHVGSLIYVKNVDPLDLRTGDPVTFMLNETTVATHRIIAVIPDETDPTVVRFRTKGDNNDIPDGEPLHSANVIGKPLFSIPLLGYVANYIQTPPGRYVALGACILLLIAVMIPTGEKTKKGDSADEAEDASAEGAEDKPSDLNSGVTPQGSQYNPNKKTENKEETQ
jgi:signal peptidase